MLLYFQFFQLRFFGSTKSKILAQYSTQRDVNAFLNHLPNTSGSVKVLKKNYTVLTDKLKIEKKNNHTTQSQRNTASIYCK